MTDAVLEAIGLSPEEIAALNAEHVEWAWENRRRQREALEMAATWPMP